jgi:alkylhydroperoxidase/carboxymuconolactone decarboxylase family protein YurZ
LGSCKHIRAFGARELPGKWTIISNALNERRKYEQATQTQFLSAAGETSRRCVRRFGETRKELARGPVNERTAHLIQLAAAAAIRSEGAVHSHTRRAIESGATADEIHHALLILLSTIGMPNVVAAMSWADDVLRKK